MENPISAADGTDFLYQKHGRSWRVRVREKDAIAANVPINGEHEVEAAGQSIIVSVALLDDVGEVATTATGKLRIFPAHVLTFLEGSFGRVDPAAEIETIVQKQIDEANRQLSGKDQLSAALAPFVKAQPE